jgi:drug/metabolite transporter (DMT)-like permease
MSNNKLAIFLIIISVFFGTVMLSFLRIAQEDVNVYVAGFFRFFLGLVIIMPYIIKTNFVVLKTNHIKKHLLRAGTWFACNAFILFFISITTYRKSNCNIFCCTFDGNNTCSIFFR